MALNENGSETPAAETKQQALAQATKSGGAPPWIVPLYLGGLALVLLGERILVAQEGAATGASALGVVALLVATVVRFLPQFSAAGDRARIERLLGILSAIGVLAIGLYFASTDAGLAKLGLE
jgi:hypothetical protein